MAPGGLSGQVEGWVVGGTLGRGRRGVDADGSTPTELAELSVTSPIAGPVFWRARVGYSRASGLDAWAAPAGVLAAPALARRAASRRLP